MPEETERADQYSQKILTDARAAVDPAEAEGITTGQVALEQPHVVRGAAFNTGALYQDVAPSGATAAVPASGAYEGAVEP